MEPTSTSPTWKHWIGTAAALVFLLAIIVLLQALPAVWALALAVVIGAALTGAGVRLSRSSQ